MAKKKEEKKVSIATKISPELLLKVKIECVKNGIKMKDFFSQAIEEKIKK